MTGPGLGFGLRLTFGGSRDGRFRLLLMVGGVAVGVALLLGVTGALPAAAERIGKTATRGVAIDAGQVRGQPGDAGQASATGIRARLSVGLWRGQEVHLLLVETVGRGVPPPPGVPRTPGPGEVFASPALSRALAGHRAELAPRLPGTVVGPVGHAGLLGPDELYAVAGVPAGVLDGPLYPGFATPSGGLFDSQGAYLDGTGSRQESGPVDELLIVASLAAVGLIVPLLVLIGTSTRLSAASRERRAAAMRLVGATAGQLRRFGAIEGAVVGGCGAVLGAVLFGVLRAPAAAVIPVRAGLYAGDIAPPPLAALLVLVGIPVLTAVVGGLAVRRAVSAPLSVRRQAAPPRLGAARLIPLAAGLLLLLGGYVDRSAVLRGAWSGRVLVLGGAALCLVGIALGAGTLSRLAGLLLTRVGPGLTGQLAGRRLLADPAGAARAVTGTALVVVAVGWALALAPVLAPTPSTDSQRLATALRPDTMVVTLGPDARLDPVVAALRDVPGVGAIAPARSVSLLPPGTSLASEFLGDHPPRIGDQPVRAVVADCGQLAAVLRAPLAGCRPGTIQHLSTGTFDAATVAAAGRLAPLLETPAPMPAPAVRTPVLRVPAVLTSVTVPDSLADSSYGFALHGDLLVPPALVPADVPAPDFPYLLVATDGAPSTLEAVRASLGPALTPYPPTTPQEAVALARSGADGYGRAALLAIVAVVLAGGLSLTVTTVDAVRERHRAHAALVAMGTPAAVLRRSVLLQTALPLLLNIGLAVLVAAGSSWLYLRLSATPAIAPPALPWTGYVTIAASAIIACVLATAAALPFVRAAARPDGLRME